ncbi:MAG TPA: VCBS repeat domain-containing M23 family metallopeptidase [Kofleriaceae bacterium]|nr:VCBS repeat domain-containing M23 family metallopeptidase [Kofleriaceae bacterium]
MHRRIEVSRLAALAAAMVSACAPGPAEQDAQQAPPPSATATAAAAVSARPLFQLPFPCGQTWVLFSYSTHNPNNLKIDMQRIGGGTAGSPVVASMGGTVHAWHDPGGVEIDHGGGWFSLYLHMTNRSQPGQHVNQGQQIGLTGNVGTNVPHLHYELRIDANGSGSSTNNEIVVSSFDGVFYDMGVNGEKAFNVVSKNCGSAPPPAPPVSETDRARGDFNGDGFEDIGGFYDYGGGLTRLWLWRGTAGGFTAPVVVWDGGPNSWNMAQSRFVTGDFDGDSKVDIGGFYDYGGGLTRLWVWRGTAGGFTAPVVAWDGGPNSWNTAQSRFVTGDFDGDGKADIGGFYDYGGALTRLWVWRGTAAGVSAPAVRWESAVNGWNLPQSRLVTGDFDGDGKADIGGFYDYSGGLTRLWLWRGTISGFTAPAVAWDGGPNNWVLPQSRFVTGDFDGDGVSDIGGFYDYGGALTRLWVWHGTASGLAPAVQTWDSGPNNWVMTQTRFL